MKRALKFSLIIICLVGLSALAVYVYRHAESQWTIKYLATGAVVGSFSEFVGAILRKNSKRVREVKLTMGGKSVEIDLDDRQSLQRGIEKLSADSK